MRLGNAYIGDIFMLLGFLMLLIVAIAMKTEHNEYNLTHDKNITVREFLEMKDFK